MKKMFALMTVLLALATPSYAALDIGDAAPAFTTSAALDGKVTLDDSADFLTIAPWAPRFPFETWILPKQHESAVENSPSGHYEGLARALKNVLGRMNSALESPAYNLVIHTSPVMESTNDFYHWHIELMPKLTKVAGFEWGTGFYINPTPPEESAAFLREAQAP